MGPACWGSAFFLLSVAVNAKIPFYGDLGGFIDAERNKLYDDMVYGNDNIPYKGDNSIEIRMPNVHPVRHDSYFCTASPVASKETYIVGYDPHAEMHTAHHMLLFGCSTPASNEPHWNCGEMGDVQNGVCAQGSAKKILYAWAGNAPSLDLPEGVAFKVGQDSDVKYLVLQVHYGHVDKFVKNPNLRDDSGITIRTTPKRTTHLAGIIILAADYDKEGGISPHQQDAHLDLACEYSNPADMHPFAIRTHTHSLGTVMTGYRERNGDRVLIGKGDPQKPQAFYPLKNKLVIKSGDIVAARCTYNTMAREKVTNIGPGMKDEMCNFYMMFYYDPRESSEYSPEDSCLKFSPGII